MYSTQIEYLLCAYIATRSMKAKGVSIPFPPWRIENYFWNIINKPIIAV